MVAHNVRRLRQAAQLSQEELAFRAEVNRAYLSTVESGQRNISLDNLIGLARGLHVEPWELLRPIDAPLPTPSPPTAQHTQLAPLPHSPPSALCYIALLPAGAPPPTTHEELTALEHITLERPLLDHLAPTLAYVPTLNGQPLTSPGVHSLDAHGVEALRSVLTGWRSIWQAAPDPILLHTGHLIQGAHATLLSIPLDRTMLLRRLDTLLRWLPQLINKFKITILN
jgi:transcriptional regulator with XRE-family HTH domain